MAGPVWHFRYGSKSGRASACPEGPRRANSRSQRTLFNHFVGAAEQHRWHFEAERFRSLEIDTQIEFGRLEKRDISRIRTFKNFIDEVGEAAKHLRLINRISHQSATFHKFAERINCGNPAFRCQFDNCRSIGDMFRFFRYHERIHTILSYLCEDALVLCLVKSGAQHSRRQHNSRPFGHLSRCRTSYIFPVWSRCKVTDGGQFWHRLDQESHTFSNYFVSPSDSNACDVAARPRDACHKSEGNRIEHYRHNRNCRRRHLEV